MHFIITIFRNIYHNKFFSIINITGLAIGLSCAIFILLYLQDELTYDKHHVKHKNIYRLESDFTISDKNQQVAKSPFPFGPAFLREFPEVKAFTRFRDIDRTSFRHNGKIIYSDRAFYADSSVFRIFTHLFIHGNPDNALVATNTMVLTKKFSEKLFGRIDPVGKYVVIGNGIRCMVTGVIEDPPPNSHVRFDLLVSMHTYARVIGKQMYRDLNTKHFWAIRLYTFVLLEDNSSIESIIKKFPAFYDKYMADFGKQLNGSYSLMATPLADIHLQTALGWDFPTGNMDSIYIFTVIAFIILLIAAINYMNLATARSSLKAKDVGVRKVIGASRAHLIRLFLAESVVQTFIALVFALLIVELFLPIINTISGKQLDLEYMGNSSFLAIIFMITLLIGVIAGSYPAFYLSSFMPATILRDKANTGRKSGMFRKIMITFQFTVSIIMISVIIVITQQINYMNNIDPGFNKEGVLVSHVNDTSFMKRIPSFKEELLMNPRVKAISTSLSTPGLGMFMDVMMVEGLGKKEEHLMSLLYVDEDYLSLMEIKMILGRSFDPQYKKSDYEHAVIINQATARKFGWDNKAIGKKIFTGYQNPKEYKVIGMVKDFHFNSLHDQIGPMIFFMTEHPNNYLSIRIDEENRAETIAFIEKKWKQFNANAPYEYTYLDVLLKEQYAAEGNLQKLIAYFALISIFISLLGIFGLSSFVTEQFNREIGIRKVFGATVGSIVYFLSRDFLHLVLIAFFIAVPIAWYGLRIWLHNFNYHIDLHLYGFILAGLSVLVISQLTVLLQSLKAASKSPLEVLKYE
ncbi:MAG: ABC transporter permease [Bacteroidota bacterium]|nr:ABC transporter permease [Bacteroidota bacterium]